MRRLLPILLFGCVPPLALEDAPCPCDDGYTCCDTLAVCLPNGAVCPSTLPPSSNQPCASDSECNEGEACAAWRVDGALSGPQVCKTTCSELACDDSERCLLSLHDGRPAADLAIAKLCLPKIAEPGCEAWICEGCPGLELGQITTCDVGVQDILGCVFALHPECGLKCEVAKVGDCNGIAAPCVEYGCDQCPGGKPGVVQCIDQVQVTCLGSNSNEPNTCAQLCAQVEVGSCE